MKLRALLAVLAALVFAGAAAANHTDPRKRLNEADQMHAKRVALRLSDLNAPRSELAGRWKAEKPAPDDGSHCQGEPSLKDLTLTGEAESPDFSRADGLLVSSAVELYATAEQARASYARSIKPYFVRCTDQAFRSGAGKLTVKTLKAGLADTPRFGDRTARYHFAWRITSGGKSVTSYADVYAVLAGRIAITVLYFSTGKAIAPAVQRQAVALVVGRA